MCDVIVGRDGFIMKILRPFQANGIETAGYLVKCPGCNELHQIAVVKYNKNGNPTWDFDGNMEAPTFSPSLQVTWNHGPDQVEHVCHSFIRNGQWQFLGDCTHDLAGKTVPMVPFD